MSVMFNRELQDIKEQAQDIICSLNKVIDKIEKYESTANKDSVILDLRMRGCSLSQIGQVVNLSAPAVRNRLQKMMLRDEEIDL